MSTYRPKASHPWKRAFQPDRESFSDTINSTKEKPRLNKPVRVFVTELAENWENIEVLHVYKAGDKKEFLPDLPVEKQALWLINLLRKAYIGSSNGYFNEYD